MNKAWATPDNPLAWLRLIADCPYCLIPLHFDVIIQEYVCEGCVNNYDDMNIYHTVFAHNLVAHAVQAMNRLENGSKVSHEFRIADGKYQSVPLTAEAILTAGRDV